MSGKLTEDTPEARQKKMLVGLRRALLIAADAIGEYCGIVREIAPRPDRVAGR